MLCSYPAIIYIIYATSEPCWLGINFHQTLTQHKKSACKIVECHVKRFQYLTGACMLGEMSETFARGFITLTCAVVKKNFLTRLNSQLSFCEAFRVVAMNQNIATVYTKKKILSLRIFSPNLQL